ncbi:MAG: cytochrome c peroxidase [Phycisphaerales bacterium JB052]
MNQEQFGAPQSGAGSRCFAIFAAVIACATMHAVAQPGGGAGQLPQVQFPSENPFSVEKSTLGKALFWDAQLSSDNTTSCGSCHLPASSGTDPRVSVNPGADGIFNSDDDIIASPGVSMADRDDQYLKSVLYGLLPQATTRQAQPMIMAMYADELFWDGRAGSQFVDPQTGAVIIADGGALESQVVGPIVSDVEMSHQERDWDEVAAKLSTVRPLALASDLPADLADAVLDGSTYPDLFAEAFGDNEINAARIAMAIATYERTLVPDETPFDQFIAGNNNAMTQQQIDGLNALTGSRCVACHTGAMFSDNSFRNIGLRPINEDPGRSGITGNNADRGRFKVPSLRNVGLRERFMHNGQLSTIDEVFDFYARRNGQVSFAPNRDPVLNAPIAFPPPVQNNITDFINNGLTDPRVANEAFPFDRPQLHEEQLVPNPQLISNGIAGTEGMTPEMVADNPPNLGNIDFKIGIDKALGGAQAWVVVSSDPPVNGMLDADETLGPIVLQGSGAGEGYGTMHYAIPDSTALDGEVRYMQWIVGDDNAPGGYAASPVAQLTYFCSRNGICIDHCQADLSGDGQLDFFDVSAFLGAYGSNGSQADFTGDGSLDFFDVSAFLSAYSAGCP